jgi:hypothetical protein
MGWQSKQRAAFAELPGADHLVVCRLLGLNVPPDY